MNDGVNTTPEQAARSLRIVRLVSFGASAALAIIALLVVAPLRYPLQRPEAHGGDVVVSEIAAPTAREIQQPRPRPERDRVDAQSALPPAPVPAPAPAASEPVIVTAPVWVERPRYPERFYPREAFMQGVAGEVILDCDVDVGGRLSCSVASETPEGRGFGEAALRIAQAHVMRPATRDGAPAPARYRMIVPFSPGG